MIMYKNVYNVFEIKLKSCINYFLFMVFIEFKKFCMLNSIEGVYWDLWFCRDCLYVDNVIVYEVNILKKKVF